MTVQWITADVFTGIAQLDDNSVDLVVTSPPFLALRSYLPSDHPDKAKEIGSEKTPAEYIDTLLAVTAELRRVVAPHGSICIELGDTYSGSGGAGGDYGPVGLRAGQPEFDGSAARTRSNRPGQYGTNTGPTRKDISEGWPLAKSKALIPQLFETALAYGINPLTGAKSPAGQWRVRNIVTWVRPNPPPGSLGDKWRPATSDVIVACTSEKRYWDDLATRQPFKYPDAADRPRIGHKEAGKAGGNTANNPGGAPLLDYWEIPPSGYHGAHYAVFPPELVEPLIRAMCPPGGTVLDPFAGSGTTLAVADALERNAIGIDINEANQALFEGRSYDPYVMGLRQLGLFDE